MLEEDNKNIESTNSACRTLEFDGEVVLMTEEEKDRKLACTKLKRDERRRRKTLGLPEDFVFHETFTTEDIDREVQIMSIRRSNRGRTLNTGEEVTNGAEVRSGNWGGTRSFGGRDRGRRATNDGSQNDLIDSGESSENNTANAIVPGSNENNDERSSSERSEEISDDDRDEDLATLTREELLVKCERYQDELDELKRKLDEEIGGRPKKRVRKQLPEPKTWVEKRLVKNMKIVLRTYIIHHVSNQPKGWEVYNNKGGSMCQIIMNKMNQWPAEWTKEDRMNAWKTLLGPRLNREWSYAKNEVVTRMRLVCLGMSNILLIVTSISYYIFSVVFGNTGEMNTDREIKVNDLDNILKTTPAALLRQVSPLLQTLAQFVCQYAMCVCTRSDIKNLLRSEQETTYEENPEDEEDNNFGCVLDYQTNVDVAFTWMQYVNHIEEWKFKKFNVATPDGGQRWTPKFTGVMGGRKNGGCVLDEDGSKLYDSVKNWIAQFRMDKNYNVFRKLCNGMSRNYGLIKPIKRKRKGNVGEGHEDDEDSESSDEDLPLFDFTAVVVSPSQEGGTAI
jgi:hypothetical protein